MLNRQRFKGLNNFGEKRIGYFRNDQSENATFSGYQRARLTIGVISEFVDCLPNALGQLRINGRDPVDSPGYSCSRHFGPSGNVADVQASSLAMSYGFGRSTLPRLRRSDQRSSQVSCGALAIKSLLCRNSAFYLGKKGLSGGRGEKGQANASCQRATFMGNVYADCPVALSEGIARYVRI